MGKDLIDIVGEKGMSKRVNNRKGYPSKNKGNVKMLRNMRDEQSKLRKLYASKSLPEKLVTQAKKAFQSVSRRIKEATPKRYNRSR